ncbi:MAG: DUF2501 domain-containing protein [Sphingobium phenoxybenzoativorans]
MPHAFIRTATIALLLTTASAAPAQLSGLGQSGLLGAILPNVASVGASNAAGVIGYCLKNKFLGGTNAKSVLGKLAGQSGVKSSDGYANGQNGLLQMDGGSSLSLGSLKAKAKSKVCDVVLQHAQSFL